MRGTEIATLVDAETLRALSLFPQHARPACLTLDDLEGLYGGIDDSCGEVPIPHCNSVPKGHVYCVPTLKAPGRFEDADSATTLQLGRRALVASVRATRGDFELPQEPKVEKGGCGNSAQAEAPRKLDTTPSKVEQGAEAPLVVAWPSPAAKLPTVIARKGCPSSGVLRCPSPLSPHSPKSSLVISRVSSPLRPAGPCSPLRTGEGAGTCSPNRASQAGPCFPLRAGAAGPCSPLRVGPAASTRGQRREGEASSQAPAQAQGRTGAEGREPGQELLKDLKGFQAPRDDCERNPSPLGPHRPSARTSGHYSLRAAAEGPFTRRAISVQELRAQNGRDLAEKPQYRPLPFRQSTSLSGAVPETERLSSQHVSPGPQKPYSPLSFSLPRRPSTGEPLLRSARSRHANSGEWSRGSSGEIVVALGDKVDLKADEEQGSSCDTAPQCAPAEAVLFGEPCNEAKAISLGPKLRKAAVGIAQEEASPSSWQNPPSLGSRSHGVHPRRALLKAQSERDIALPGTAGNARRRFDKAQSEKERPVVQLKSILVRRDAPQWTPSPGRRVTFKDDIDA